MAKRTRQTKKASKKATVRAPAANSKRTYVSQEDIPSLPLDKASRIADVLAGSFGKQSTRPLRVAEALDMTPTSSAFRVLCGASIAYGLTQGGSNAEVIELTPLGRRVVAPTVEGDDTVAMREAVLRPRVIREFLKRYSGSKLPPANIAKNVLEDELAVPANRAEGVFEFIVASAQSAGFLREMKGNSYVDLEDVVQAIRGDEESLDGNPGIGEGGGDPDESDVQRAEPGAQVVDSPREEPAAPSVSKVFITHGRNTAIVDQLKKLLRFGKFDPIVSVERESVSKSVPDKVMDDLRDCQAAVIHVDAELKLVDEQGKPHHVLNPNVLIEIGAAMALYGRNFILLVADGTQMPSNLQGLYEVRYSGEMLDYEATMKLLEAFNSFRS